MKYKFVGQINQNRNGEYFILAKDEASVRGIFLKLSLKNRRF